MMIEQRRVPTLSPINISYQSGALKHTLIGIVLSIAVIVAGAWLLFPPSYSTDLTVIGNGKPAIVLVYDSDNLASHKLVENFNEIRVDYEESISFLIADPNMPEGKLFERKYDAVSSSAVFFSPEGESVLVIHGPRELDVFRDAIKENFGL